LSAADHRAIAEAFVTARLQAKPLPAYPGERPMDMDSAYACQDAAISLWPDHIVGWKVGWIADPFAATFGERRLVGPIFAANLREDGVATPVSMPVYAQGFSAVEAEYVFELKHDAGGSTDWTERSVGDVIANLRLGIEIASSPLAAINDLGPAVTASDFGNNAGLVVGPPFGDWQHALERAAQCQTVLDGKVVGTGGAGSIGGGPLAGLAFALNRNARRGRAMRAGELVTTGAATGVHPVRPGQLAVARFGAAGEIACRIVAAQPRPIGQR
jgi:2-keto-4-pentenoate hydratase